MINSLYNPDYNLLAPDDLDYLIRHPLETAVGKKEFNRAVKVVENYRYYDGYQYKDEYGNLVKAEDLPKPPNMDYEPSRFHTNYFKAFIKRKARWQMGGDHGVAVKPKSQSQADVDLAKHHQELIYQLWEDNNFNRDRIRIARDRLLGGRVVAKLAFNQRTGRLHWIWHTAQEVFLTYSDDGFDDLLGGTIIIPQDDDENEGLTQYWVQRFRMNDDFTNCYFEEIIYDDQLEVKRVVTEETPLDLDFVPLIKFDVRDLVSRDSFNDELGDMRTLTDKLNEMMADATDSLKFEMFNVTVIENAEPGTAEKMQIAPGAVVEVSNTSESTPARLRNIENGFKWKEAYKDQYNRIKSALHELSGLPQIVPQELNFGGLNDRALQVLYQDIIQETEEQWLAWADGFKELHEKSVKYLQARTDSRRFAYDKDVVNAIEDYTTEMNFGLPLPDDRSSLVELLTVEVDNGFESQHGALRRLGVQNVEEKITEMNEEKVSRIELFDPYANNGGSDVVDENVSEDIIVDDVAE